jgi:hypothetical protein
MASKLATKFPKGQRVRSNAGHEGTVVGVADHVNRVAVAFPEKKMIRMCEADELTLIKEEDSDTKAE